MNNIINTYIDYKIINNLFFNKKWATPLKQGYIITSLDYLFYYKINEFITYITQHFISKLLKIKK